MHNTVATAHCRMPLNAVHEVWGSYTLLKSHKTIDKEKMAKSTDTCRYPTGVVALMEALTSCIPGGKRFLT